MPIGLHKKYVLGSQKNCLIETVLLSTNNICFGWEIIRKLMFCIHALLTNSIKALLYIKKSPSREGLTLKALRKKCIWKCRQLKSSAANNCLALPLSSTGGISSNTDLSDLSTVGTCDIFVYQMCHSHVIRPIGWFNIVYQACHHVSLKPFLWKCHAENVFKNVLVHTTIWSVYGWIPQYLSLLWFGYPKWLDISIEGLSVGI